MLWDQIQYAYAAILRAQQIMHVKDANDMAKEVMGESSGSTKYGSSESTSWQVQQAWDRQATFLSAMARQQSVLNSMIKQYDDLCRSPLVTEEQQVRIEKLRSDMDINRRRREIAHSGEISNPFKGLTKEELKRLANQDQDEKADT